MLDLDGLAGAGHLVLAVSGGPDSVALMLLAARQPLAGTRFSVATVDHGLREGSAGEAANVAAWAAALGFAHETLVWAGPKPRTGIQEKARDARYGLLCAHARATGASGIVTAHHAGDQAETILFRLGKGSGIAGLAGMRAKTMRGTIAHWRPLLQVPKTVLSTLCQQAGHGYFDDPSNRNHAFSRPRLRRLAGLLQTEGLDHAGLLRLGQRAARAEDALSEMTARAAREWQAQRAAGVFSAPAAFLATVPAELGMRLVGREIAGVTGLAEPLRLERLERGFGRMTAAIASGSSLATSLGGALLRLDRSGTLHITPEPPRRRGRHTGPPDSVSPLPPHDAEPLTTR